MSLASQILQYVLTGITVGSIYGLVGLGFNIIYAVTEVINFAQGEFVVLGGMLMVFLTSGLKLSLGVSFLLTVAGGTLVGVMMDRFTIKPLKDASVLQVIIVTLAVSIVLKGLMMFAWGKDSFFMEPFAKTAPIKIAGAVVHPQTPWVLGLTVLVVIALTIFFKKTRFGKAMVACADDREAASLMGVRVNTMVLLSFALSAAIGAIAGLAITPITLMEYDRGALLAIKGFGAAVLGGLGHFSGAVVAGIILGLIESLTAGLISSGYKDAAALLVLLVVLYVRPSGIFGDIEAGKIKRF